MSNDGHLKDKTALVTGSTSGIGLGMARALAGAGAHVVLNGFGDAGEIEKLRAELAAEHGVEVRYFGADMTKEDEIATMIGRRREASSAPSTCSSTMPACSMSRRSTSSRSTNGT